MLYGNGAKTTRDGSYGSKTRVSRIATREQWHGAWMEITATNVEVLRSYSIADR